MGQKLYVLRIYSLIKVTLSSRIVCNLKDEEKKKINK